MKQLFLFFLFVSISASQLRKQPVATERENTFALFGGMGVHMVAAPDIVEYINTITTFSQRVEDFGTAVDFFGGIEFPLTKDWGIKLEHSYLFKSYSVPGNLGGTYDFYYSIQSPSILVQKVISGKGFFLKIGVPAVDIILDLRHKQYQHLGL